MSNTTLSLIGMLFLLVGKHIGWWPDLTDTTFAMLCILMYIQDIAHAAEKIADNSSRSTVGVPGPQGPMGLKGEPGRCECKHD